LNGKNIPKEILEVCEGANDEWIQIVNLYESNLKLEIIKKCTVKYQKETVSLENESDLRDIREYNLKLARELRDN
jgi:hypothetical protein